MKGRPVIGQHLGGTGVGNSRNGDVIFNRDGNSGTGLGTAPLKPFIDGLGLLLGQLLGQRNIGLNLRFNPFDLPIHRIQQLHRRDLPGEQLVLQLMGRHSK